MNSYYPVGFEFAVELTYPEPESTSSGILISTSQIVGVTLILLSGKLLESMGAYWSLFLMCTSLFIGSILTALTPNILRRQEAFIKSHELKLCSSAE